MFHNRRSNHRFHQTIHPQGVVGRWLVVGLEQDEHRQEVVHKHLEVVHKHLEAERKRLEVVHKHLEAERKRFEVAYKRLEVEHKRLEGLGHRVLPHMVEQVGRQVGRQVDLKVDLKVDNVDLKAVEKLKPS